MIKTPGFKIVKCDDGSTTLYRPDLDEHYHSVFGALTESNHIFINAGFDYLSRKKTKINVFELGFGTGLNALLTCIEAERKDVNVSYHSVEPLILDEKLISGLEFGNDFDKQNVDLFQSIHAAAWDKEIEINRHFMLKKIKAQIQDITLDEGFFDLIYFDAFAPDIQPELWSTDVFTKIYQAMKTGGVLVTYSCKGDVKRACKSVGFAIEKLPGPKGKREFLRCFK